MWNCKRIWSAFVDLKLCQALASLRRREREIVPGWYQQSLVRERLRLTNAGRYGLTITKEKR